MMQTVNVNFRTAPSWKKSMESTCQELGMSMTTAFTIFAKKVTREKRIPFDVSIDPFYSDKNIRYLADIASDVAAGRAHLSEHILIDADE